MGGDFNINKLNQKLIDYFFSQSHYEKISYHSITLYCETLLLEPDNGYEPIDK